MFDDKIKEEYRSIRAPERLRQRIAETAGRRLGRKSGRAYIGIAAAAVIAVSVLLTAYFRTITVRVDTGLPYAALRSDTEETVEVDISVNARAAVSVSEGRIRTDAGTADAGDSIFIHGDTTICWDVQADEKKVYVMIIEGFFNRKRIVLEYDGNHNKWILSE